MRFLGESARAWLSGVATGEPRGDPALDAARAALAERLDACLRASTNELIGLHGLSGRAADEITQRMGAAYAVDQAANAGKASVIGAAVSGALGGLVADLAAGGLTFGAGALLGGLVGAAGAHGLARAYNVARGRDSTALRWSPDFLSGRVTAAVLRYLAVAHFGRGRGDFVQTEYPPQWPPIVEREVAVRRLELEDVWRSASQGTPESQLQPRLLGQVRATSAEVLRTLYPEHRLPF